MKNYSISCQKKINDTFKIYFKSLDKKEDFKFCYDRHVRYLNEGKKLPFSADDFYNAFRAKNFFKDLIDCGSWLEFRWYLKSDVTKLQNANFCKRDKLCPACAVRRAYKQQNKFLEILNVDTSLKNCDWYYIVIPVKHSKEDRFETVLQKIERIRKKIIQSLNDGRKGKTSNIWSVFGGGMYSVEVTHTKNGWNVHINLMINAPIGSKLPLKAIRNRKGQVSYQNAEITQFLMANADSKMHNISKIENNEDMRGHLVEVLKYSLKFSSLTNQQLLEVFIKTRRKRLFGSFGNMYGKDLENVKLDDDEKLDEEFLELIFKRGLFGYELTSELLKKHN